MEKSLKGVLPPDNAMVNFPFLPIASFEIETIRNKRTKERDFYINTKRVSKESTEQIVSKFNHVIKVFQTIEKTNLNGISV